MYDGFQCAEFGCDGMTGTSVNTGLIWRILPGGTSAESALTSSVSTGVWAGHTVGICWLVAKQKRSSISNDVVFGTNWLKFLSLAIYLCPVANLRFKACKKLRADFSCLLSREGILV